MTTLVEELSQKARALSPEDRARLAEDLLASLEDGPESSAVVEAAWEHEIRQRVEEVKSGTAKLVPAEDVYAETRRIYQKRELSDSTTTRVSNWYTKSATTPRSTAGSASASTRRFRRQRNLRQSFPI